MEQQGRLEYASNPLQLPTPSVDIIIVNSRGADNPWFINCLQSCQQQTYPNLGQLVVYNNDRALSIGQAYNLGVANSHAEFVLFVGDDDLLSVDLVSHLVGVLSMVERGTGQPLQMATSFCTLIDADGRPLCKPAMVEGMGHITRMLQVMHTGLYRRSFLLEQPFDESLSRGVGRAMQHRLASLQKASGKRMYWANAYHYGYHYRQHVGMASQENFALRIA